MYVLIISVAALQSKSQGRGMVVPNLAAPRAARLPARRRRYLYLLNVKSTLASPESAPGLLCVFAPSCQPHQVVLAVRNVINFVVPAFINRRTVTVCARGPCGFAALPVDQVNLQRSEQTRGNELEFGWRFQPGRVPPCPGTLPGSEEI